MTAVFKKMGVLVQNLDQAGHIGGGNRLDASCGPTERSGKKRPSCGGKIKVVRSILCQNIGRTLAISKIKWMPATIGKQRPSEERAPNANLKTSAKKAFDGEGKRRRLC